MSWYLADPLLSQELKELLHNREIRQKHWKKGAMIIVNLKTYVKMPVHLSWCTWLDPQNRTVTKNENVFTYTHITCNIDTGVASLRSTLRS